MNETYAKLLENLIEAGTPARLVAQVASLATKAEFIRQRRETDKFRQQKLRMSRDVTRRHMTSRDPPPAYTTPPEEERTLASLAMPADAAAPQKGAAKEKR